MDSNRLPTTALAVEAALRADADFRGISDDAQVHYLLGMCMARLGSANARIERLERLVAALEPSYAALCECHDLLDDYSDVIDGEDGPRPNRAMSLLTEVEAAIRKADAR